MTNEMSIVEIIEEEDQNDDCSENLYHYDNKDEYYSPRNYETEKVVAQ